MAGRYPSWRTGDITVLLTISCMGSNGIFEEYTAWLELISGKKLTKKWEE
jgi:hypothetical protein